jgi:hypothetical protein
MLRPPRVADPRPTCTVAEAVSVLHCTPYSNSVRLSRRVELNAVKRDLSVQSAKIAATAVAASPFIRRRRRGKCQVFQSNAGPAPALRIMRRAVHAEPTRTWESRRPVLRAQHLPR